MGRMIRVNKATPREGGGGGGGGGGRGGARGGFLPVVAAVAAVPVPVVHGPLVGPQQQQPLRRTLPQSTRHCVCLFV